MLRRLKLAKVANDSNFSGAFFVGQKVEAKFVGDSSVVLRGEVVKRSKCFVWVNIEGEGVKQCKAKVYDGVEHILPLGNYSMAPRFKAV